MYVTCPLVDCPDTNTPWPDEALAVECQCTFNHPYPPTKISFAPSSYRPSDPSKDLLATTGDYLRLWSTDGEVIIT